MTQVLSAKDTRLSTEQLLKMYRQMVTIRKFEEKAFELFTGGRLPGFLHMSSGQEAVPVGTCAALRPDDYIVSHHRGHGDIIAKGARIDRMMAEIFAKEPGYCRAKGGSMHMADFSLGIIGANGIVGAGIPIANGVALSLQMRGTDQVVACFFGDGATNQGGFHEALNLASVWDLPVVFVCENNQYALSTPITRHQKNKTIAERAKSYDIPGYLVDGMDALDVYNHVAEAVERARAGQGPTLLDCRTYRYGGHSIGDPGLYRTKEEIDQWRARDPIPAFRQELMRRGILSQDAVARIEEECQAALEEAVRYAEGCPEPEIQEALEDLYV